MASKFLLRAYFRSGKTWGEQAADDGCGMSPDKLEELRRRLREGTETEEHIGLLNVNERLKLCYGADCTLQVESRENAGTRVWFVIKE